MFNNLEVNPQKLNIEDDVDDALGARVFHK